jgi:predicted metalloprotease with PDZ domain
VTFTSSRSRLLIPTGLCILFILTLSSSGRATIQYTVILDHPERHLFHVTMTIPDVADEVIVRMPAWNALYQVRDFSSHVQQVEAFAGPKKAFIEKTDKQTWRVKGTGMIKVTYATY